MKRGRKVISNHGKTFTKNTAAFYSSGNAALPNVLDFTCFDVVLLRPDRLEGFGKL